MLEQIIEKTKNIELPEELDTLAKYIGDLGLLEKTVTVAIAIVTAKAFEVLNRDAERWLEWAKKTFSYERSHNYKLKSVGLMLIWLHNNHRDTFDWLFEIGFSKLAPISGLKDYDKILPFLEENDVEALTRDEIREAVEVFNDGRRKKGSKTKKPVQGVNPNDLLWQPDMFEIMTTVASWDESATAEAAKDERLDVWTPARSGLSLLDVAIRKLEGGSELADELYQALLDTLEEDVRQLKQAKM